MPDNDWTPLTPAQQRAKEDAEANAKGGATIAPARPGPVGVPGATVPPPSEDGPVEVEEITGAHLAEMRAAEEGFTGDLATKDGPTGTTPMPATPQEAITIIEKLTNDNLRLETERNAACAEVDKYYKEFGPLPEDA